MPLDSFMRDGTLFDPNKPRLTYDEPPRLPPRDGGERRDPENGKGAGHMPLSSP